MIAMLARNSTRFAAQPDSLQRRWKWAVNRLLIVMLVSGLGSLGGTIYLVASARGTAQGVEVEGRVLAQLREDVVAETIYLAGIQGAKSNDPKQLAQLDAAVTSDFAHAHDVELSSQGHELLVKAQASWSAGLARIAAVPAGAPAAVRGLVLGQVLGVEAPIVLVQLDDASDAGRTAARANMDRDKVTAALTVAVLAILMLIGLVMVKRFGRRLTSDVLEPVSVLRRSADKLATGDLSHRVELTGDDEIGALATSFNAMADAVAGSQHTLTMQANHDSLTGLANRAGFREKVEVALVRPDRRQGCQAVLFLDLDDFKDVNDLLGHGAGDELLRVVSTRLLQVVRPGDLVARLGGDEFAVHLDQVPSAREAYELAQRLVEALREPAVIMGQVVQVGASIGLAMVEPGAGLDEVLQEADMAMYSAKGQGKNRVECYDSSLHLAVVEHHGLKADVAHAVEREELVLDYQPVINLVTGELTGVEALVRWQHPTRGLLPPSAFIDLAEKTGAMSRIGLWVLEESVRQMDNWQRRYDLPDLVLAVNVSAVQLTDPGFVDAVAAVLATTHMRPSTLTLEVTESLLVDEHGPVPEALHALRVLGVRVAIDDFGTGYASIGHLKILPVDILKIDRSFVTSAREGVRGEALLGALIEMAVHLGFDVIPEGIELAEDLRRLQFMGCSSGQGFLLSRPVGVEEIDAWLASPARPLALELGLSEISRAALLPKPRPSDTDSAIEVNP
ncbi:MAG: domain S-box-containing protein/diguanylate cyclase protein [Frankiales bacterium]|nr:domain S-box-containing protein/diguanylate cyclase protein [Frankiales bacterium]